MLSSINYSFIHSTRPPLFVLLFSFFLPLFTSSCFFPFPHNERIFPLIYCVPFLSSCSHQFYWPNRKQRSLFYPFVLLEMIFAMCWSPQMTASHSSSHPGSFVQIRDPKKEKKLKLYPLFLLKSVNVSTKHVLASCVPLSVATRLQYLLCGRWWTVAIILATNCNSAWSPLSTVGYLLLT